MKLLLPKGDVKKADVPVNQQVSEVVNDIVFDLNLPKKNKLGMKVRHQLYSNLLKRHIRANETFESVGIPVGDHIQVRSRLKIWESFNSIHLAGRLALLATAILILTMIVFFSCQGNNPVTDDFHKHKAFEYCYKRARSLFEKGFYDMSLEEFKMLRQGEDRSDLADNVQYWIGECYYGLKEFGKAEREFKKVLFIKNSNKIKHAKLMLAQSCWKQKKLSAALYWHSAFIDDIKEAWRLRHSCDVCHAFR